VIEQATKLRKPASQVNPSMYRCAKTVPAPPYSERGGCNPDYESAFKLAGGTATILPFSLETESATSLQDRLTAGSLTSETLTKAYLTRIALVNAEGPALQAVRALNSNAVAEARALDAERASSGARGPLHGLPVLIDDSIDARGLPTTAGSIALQKNLPGADSALVAKLKAAGAIILGKTNVGELNGLFDANMPEGYSSLGGQVLMASDTDNSPGGSSAGSTASTAEGLAALTFGLETSTDTAQFIAPAGIAGVVALKPTVGTVSTDGVLGVAKSQDSLGPITRTVSDAATALSAVSGVAYPLSAGSLAGKKVGVTSSTTAPFPAVLAALTGAGATTVTKTVPAAPAVPSIVTSEFKRDLDAYLLGRPGVNSLQGIINYNSANPVEGLKFQQRELVAAASPDLTNYASDLAAGKAASAALIDGLLSDVEVMVVPSGDGLVGIADRAGYPVLTVPAGYGAGGAGRNPIGVTFVAGAGQEAKLLSAAYAFEQATNVRLAPSWTNPSMFRCVPGSTFFSPHHCHPGDLLGTVPFGPDSFVAAGDVGAVVPATLSLVLGAAPAFGAFTPGVAKTYTASTTATVVSTAGDATLTVADPTGTGKLVNGAFSLASPLGGLGVVKTWSTPVSNDVVTVTFSQAISATEPLRTGAYAKTLTYTLSTTTP
jgi:Asp-tRNA(Asn)/Glu-tRNA(Gln) amidotransferase A subunit family amidase